MNSRERFRATMAYDTPDRVPYFYEGMEQEVMSKWRKQGLPSNADLYDMFSFDYREEIEPDLDPHFRFRKWPSARHELGRLKRALNPNDPGRLPKRWNSLMSKRRKRDHVLILRVHRGFFLTLGVNGWKRFKEVIYLTKKDPEYVREAMGIQGEFAALLAERALKDLEFDAALFVEPIAENHGPLI